jgi:hypothetical protein
MKLFYCFLTSFFLLEINSSQAQIPIKIKAGAARSNLHLTDGFHSEDPIATYYAGIATTLPIGKRFFFQPELLYSRRGSDVKPYSSDNSKLMCRYGYISMPLLVGWHPFKKMSLLLGAEPGYMVWDRRKDNRYELTYEDVDRRFNVDIDLGLSYQPLPRWTIEVRATAGLIGLYEELEYLRISRTIYKTGKYQGYHSMIQFGISYDIIHRPGK